MLARTRGLLPAFIIAIAWGGVQGTSGCGSDNDATFPGGGGGADASDERGFNNFGDAAGDGPTTGSSSCATPCGTGQLCVAGSCVCPPYQSFCNGACIPTSIDPANCGGCGVQCKGAEVCSAGSCGSECLPGLDVCGNSCVDLKNDSKHCGTCPNECGAGTGCADGKCVDAVSVGPAPAKCAGGGSPIRVDPSQGGCLGALAQTTFRWSLCSCTDLDVSAPLTTDAYDSTKGPYKPGELGGGVGVDRDVTHWSQAVTIGGVLWESGKGSYQSSGPASEVKSDMHLGGSWSASSSFTVDKDTYVAGTLSGVTVKGTPNKVASVPAACDCGAGKLVPVAAIVAAHRAPNNDDAAIGLNPAVFDAPAGPLRLDLPCGNYYLTKIDVSTPLTIAAHGRTALYIEGDVNPSAPLAFVLDPTAELDIFIAGTIKSSQTFVVGSPNYPALSRTYVGGTATLKMSQDIRIGGEFYAANSELVDWSAKNEIYGSVFAGNFKSSNDTKIHYDRGVLVAGTACSAESGGAGGSGCNSCKDCGNQACVNGACGACTSNAQCCAPLICGNLGKCIPQIK